MDSVKRTIIKTISWRICAIIITALLVISVTGSLELAISIGVLDMVVKTTLYFCHERVWARMDIKEKDNK